MKILIGFTIFEQDTLSIILNVKRFDLVFDSMKYEVLKRTTGLHLDASRSHYHVYYLVENNNLRMYKTLDYSIKQHFCEKLKKEDIKITYVYENNQQRPRKNLLEYDELCMRYSFKEYSNDTEIPMELQLGFTDVELYAMRNQAHYEWELALRNKHSKDRQTKKEQSVRDLRMEHLDKWCSDPHIIADLKNKGIREAVRMTAKEILKHQRHLVGIGKKRNITHATVKTETIDYLYSRHIVSEDQVLDYLMI